MTTKRSAVSIVSRLDGKVLCVWNPTRKGWVLPGGKVEKDETVHAAQERELREETGLDTVFAREIYDADSVSGSGRRVHVFLVAALGTPRGVELDSPVMWMGFDELAACSPFGAFYAELLQARRRTQEKT